MILLCLYSLKRNYSLRLTSSNDPKVMCYYSRHHFNPCQNVIKQLRIQSNYSSNLSNFEGHSWYIIHQMRSWSHEKYGKGRICASGKTLFFYKRLWSVSLCTWWVRVGCNVIYASVSGLSLLGGLHCPSIRQCLCVTRLKLRLTLMWTQLNLNTEYTSGLNTGTKYKDMKLTIQPAGQVSAQAKYN